MIKFQAVACNFGKRNFLISGSSCSKISSTLASRELSQTMRPSWLLKKTPPIMVLCFSSNPYSLKVRVVCNSLPVSCFTIYENWVWEPGIKSLRRASWESEPSTDMFLSIILSIPCTINFCVIYLAFASSLITLFSLSFSSSLSCSTNRYLSCILRILWWLTTDDFSLNY